MRLLSIISFFPLAPLVSGGCAPVSHLPLAVETVCTIGLGVWIENIAVRECGSILAVGVTPNIFQIDPFERSDAQIIHSFPAPVTAVTGLTEVWPDIWYFATGNISEGTQTPVPGSMSVWEVDLNEVACSRAHGPGKARARKVVDVPDAGLLDGMTTLSPEKGLLLVSDTKLGLVWRIDLCAGLAEPILDSPNMKSIKGGVPPIGVNGVHVRDRSLYYSNTDHSTVWKLPLDDMGKAAGKADVVGYGLGATLDDFALDEKNNVYVAANNTELVFIPGDGSGKSVILAGSNANNPLSGITGAAFGRTCKDRGILYVGTTGGSFAYLTRNFTQPGGVFKLDIGSSSYWNSV